MKPDEIPALPDDVASLLGDARTLRGPTREERSRLRERLAAAMPSPPDDGGGPSAAPPSGVLPKLPMWAAALVFVAGVGVGVLLPRAQGDKREAAPSAIASVVRSANEPAAPSTGAPASSSAPIGVDLAALPSAPPAPTFAAASSARPADLAAERALLDVARTALGRGDGANALASCEEHAKKFTSGALVEEREAIAVQSLVLANRHEEAVARAERFRKRHPRSILLPAVLAAVSSGSSGSP